MRSSSVRIVVDVPGLELKGLRQKAETVQGLN